MEKKAQAERVPNRDASFAKTQAFIDNMRGAIIDPALIVNSPPATFQRQEGFNTYGVLGGLGGLQTVGDDKKKKKEDELFDMEAFGKFIGGMSPETFDKFLKGLEKFRPAVPDAEGE